MNLLTTITTFTSLQQFTTKSNLNWLTHTAYILHTIT